MKLISRGLLILMAVVIAVAAGLAKKDDTGREAEASKASTVEPQQARIS